MLILKGDFQGHIVRAVLPKSSLKSLQGGRPQALPVLSQIFHEGRSPRGLHTFLVKSSATSPESCEGKTQVNLMGTIPPRLAVFCCDPAPLWFHSKTAGSPVQKNGSREQLCSQFQFPVWESKHVFLTELPFMSRTMLCLLALPNSLNLKLNPGLGTCSK